MTDADAIYRHGTYTPLVGSAFVVHRPDGSAVEMELVEAEELSDRGQCFSLVFRGGDEALDQQMYRLEHGELGEFELFLVPIAPTEAGEPQLQAVVNRPGAER